MDAHSPRGQAFQSFMRSQRGFIVSAVLLAAFAGIVLGAIGQVSLSLMVAIIGIAPVALLFLAGQEVYLVGALPVIAIFIDMYQLYGLPLRAPVVTLALGGAILVALFLFQSEDRPWRRIPALWYWIALLGLTAIAVPRGSMTQTSVYFLTVFATPFVMYALGTQVARSARALTIVLAMLSGLSVVIALHSIVQGFTGIFLFATQRQADYLGSRYGFHLAGFTTTRAGSFLENPDWNGAYLALSFFPLLGLFLAAKTRNGRLVAGACAGLLLIALLFTFTTASWLALGVGVGVFLWLVLPRAYLKRALIALGVFAALFGIVFFRQVGLLFIHATTSQGITLRVAAWETALRVIAAHPLTGVGMSQAHYLVVSQNYQVPWQTQPLGHPHDSYLELAAFVGIPALILFLAALVKVLRLVVRNLKDATPQTQPLIGGVFTALVVLSVNSIAINGWTLPALAAIGWLMAGCVVAMRPPRVAIARLPRKTAPAAPVGGQEDIRNERAGERVAG